jgi:hypothetical protein
VSIRRDVCPQAKWDKATHAWTMTTTDAEGIPAGSSSPDVFWAR